MARTEQDTPRPTRDAAARADRAVLQQRHSVQELGSPQADRTLVLVHGFGTDQTSWDALLPTLAPTWRILRFDNAGAGAADPAAFVQHRYLGLQRYAEDLLAICAAYELKGVCLVGHSAGAMICALASLAEPQRFSRLVMLSASPRYLDDEAQGYVGGFSQEDLKQTYQAVLANYHDWVGCFAPQAMNAPDQPALAECFARALRRIPPEHALTVLCSILQSDHRQDIQRISVPTLLVHARDDHFVSPEVAHYLHSHIPGSRLAFIDAQGHFPHMSAPQQVAQALRDFL